MYFRQPIPMRPARDRLLDAAERLVAEMGAAHLTLDAVAKFAGVSKGGLLHHFHSKESLLEGMLTRHLQEVDARLAAHLADRGVKSSRAEVLRERVRVLLELQPERAGVGAAVIAASADNPALMAGCRARYRELLDEFGKPPGDFERSALVLLATQGLLFAELLHLSPYTPEERTRLVAALLRAADQCGKPS